MGHSFDTQMFDALSSSGTRDSSRPSSIAAGSSGIESSRSESPLPEHSYSLPGWQITAFLKRQKRAASFPSAWLLPDSALPGPDVVNVADWCSSSTHLTPLEQDITASTACEIVERIACGQWTSLQVVQAFCHRASIAQQILNCITEVCFHEALSRANELDAYLAREGKTIGPLHGLPISFKDQFAIKGLDLTMGYVGWSGRIANEDATLVALARQAGAIPICKTNVPSTLMSGHTDNALFGRTLNPIDRSLTVGGSSGGCAALVAFGGSPISIGTDIGGSVRVPATNTGLYSIRPSHGILSLHGAAENYPGLEAARSCAGPLCRSAGDVELFMKSIAAMKPWLYDPQIIPWPVSHFLLPSAQEPLCFGWSLKGDGIVQPSPPVQRALILLRQALEAAGHRFVEYYPVEGPAVTALLGQILMSDAGQSFSRDLASSGEPWPVETREWIETALRDSEPATVAHTLTYNQARRLLAKSFHDRWQATKEITGTGRPIDGLCLPVLPSAAQPLCENSPYSFAPLSVLMDITTICFNVTNVSQEQDKIDETFVAQSEADATVAAWYGDPSRFKASPVGLTIALGRLEEEKGCHLLKIVEAALEKARAEVR